MFYRNAFWHFFLAMGFTIGWVRSDAADDINKIAECVREKKVFEHIQYCIHTTVGEFGNFDNKEQVEKFLRRAADAVCKTGATTDCFQQALGLIEPCLDDETKKLLDVVVDVDKAARDYLCKDNGQRFIELVLDTDNIQCLSGAEGIEQCVTPLQTITVDIDLRKLFTEDQCTALNTSLQCAAEKFSAACAKPDFINYVKKGLQIMLKATPCESYVTEDADAAGSLSSGVWSMLTALIVTCYAKLR